MPKIKSERHHWWPRSLSDRWKDQDGCVHWLLPDGQIRRVPPKNLAVIGNGHHIKLGKSPGEVTPWDQSFEKVFQRADSNFPRVIDWLDSLPQSDHTTTDLSDRFLPIKADDGMLDVMMECLVSLVVRSPKHRENAVSLAEHYRGPLPETERNALIGLNIRHNHEVMCKALGNRGKFVIIYSHHREFIFGDGFFHNLSAEPATMHSPRMLVPVTPTIAVLFARPSSYMTNPKLMTLAISAAEAVTLNRVVQVYAKEALFYRTQSPDVIDDYRANTHLRFASARNPVDLIIDAIPGITPRNMALFDKFERF